MCPEKTTAKNEILVPPSFSVLLRKGFWQNLYHDLTPSIRQYACSRIYFWSPLNLWHYGGIRRDLHYSGPMRLLGSPKSNVWRTGGKWVQFRQMRCFSSGIVFPYWTQLPYGTLYIFAFATGSNCGWACLHLLAWSVYMPHGNWQGILMGRSPIRISCQLCQTCWWMDGRYQMKNDSLLLQQREKIRAGESGDWWWVRGTRMGTRG